MHEISKRKLGLFFFYLSKKMSRKGLYSFLDQEFGGLGREMSVLSVGAGGEINNRLMKYQQMIGFKLIQIDIDESRKPDIV